MVFGPVVKKSKLGRANPRHRRTLGQILEGDGAAQLAQRSGKVAAGITARLSLERARQMEPRNRRVDVMDTVKIEIQK